MIVTIGPEGRNKSWQGDFRETIPCSGCGKDALFAFAAHEGLDAKDKGDQLRVTDLHLSKGRGKGMWVHDLCAVAMYFCPECMDATAVLDQG